MMRHDDPNVVEQEYSSEVGLQSRISLYANTDGENPHDLIIDLVRAWRPCRVLDVGCGTGAIARPLQDIPGCDVHAIDASPQMVEVTRRRGVAAEVADVQALPFADEQFDGVIAAWMLYHVQDLDRGLREIKRVLRIGGHLIAVTNSVRHLEELWALAGRDRAREGLPFTAENGCEILSRYFAEVEPRDVLGTVTFPDRSAACGYIASYIPTAHLVDQLPDFTAPLRATRRNCVFTARKA
ncbi:MAG: class I SAM-dependent methyltransferase [Solirubrobacterales bacterium]|nr:class I SAM-dependent methyltransferase [Solirubrobacterales bacterium]